MPYTQDELQNYAFYQQLRNQDIEKYYDKIRNLVNEAAVSRSAVEPHLLVLKKKLKFIHLKKK